MIKLNDYTQNQTYKNAPLTVLLADRAGGKYGGHHENGHRKAHDEELIN